MLRKRILTFIMVIGMFFVSFFITKNSRASIGPNVLLINSVSHGDAGLNRQYDSTSGQYYYSLLRDESVVTITVQLRNLESGRTFRIVDTHGNNVLDREFTSEDSESIVTISKKPERGFQAQQYGFNSFIGLALTYDSAESPTMHYIYFQGVQFGTDNIVIESASQNNVELTKTVSGYETSDYTSAVSLQIRLKNLTVGERYDFHVQNYSFSEIADEAAKDISVDVWIDPAKRDSWITLSTAYDSYELNIYNNSENFVEFGDLYIEEVLQNNIRKFPSYDEENNRFVFELNTIEGYNVRLRVSQADTRVGGFGLSVSCITDPNRDYVFGSTDSLLQGDMFYYGSCGREATISQIPISGSNYEPSLKYNSGGTTYNAILRIVNDASVPQIKSAALGYLNYPDEEVHGNVDLRYHNQNNPLTLTVTGANYSDNEDYDITVKILRHSKTVDPIEKEVEYEHNFTLSGADLNSGKTISLDGVVLELMDEEHLIFDDDMYEVAVHYESQVITQTFNYGYNGIEHLISGYLLTDEDGEKFVGTTGGAAPGIYIGTYGENVNIRFPLYGLPRDEEFRYEILEMASDSLSLDDAGRGVAGVLSGKEIEDGKIEMIDPEEGSLYYLLIKNDSGIICWNKVQFVSYPDEMGIESISAVVNGSPLKIDYGYWPFYAYSVPSGETIAFTLHGKNFESNSNYLIKLVPSFCGFSDGEGSCIGGGDNIQKSFTGDELNNGATFEVPFIETNWGAISASFEVVGYEDSGGNTLSTVAFFKYTNSNNPGFTVELDSEETFEDEVDVFLSVGDYENLAGVNGGIAALMGDVEYDDTKLELIGAEALNDFELISGDHYVLHNIYGQVAAEDTNILKLTFRNIGLENGSSTTIRFTNISGSDGTNDITTADVSKTITHIEEEASIDSDIYNILDHFISKIATGTLVNVFRNGFELGGRATIRILSVNNEELSSSDKVGTGVKVQLIDRYGDVVSEFTVIIKGDISGDGEITITDLVKSKRHLAGLDNYTGVFQMAGDVSNTGAISITDVVKICRHVAGLEVINQ